MIDLTKYIGKRCVIQLRAPDMWLVTHQEGGKAEIIFTKSKEGQVSMAPMPFLIGNVVAVRPSARCGGVSTEKEIVEYIAIEFFDENKQKLLVELNPEAILSVTVAVDAPRIQLVGGGP